MIFFFKEEKERQGERERHKEEGREGGRKEIWNVNVPVRVIWAGAAEKGRHRKLHSPRVSKAKIFSHEPCPARLEL